MMRKQWRSTGTLCAQPGAMLSWRGAPVADLDDLDRSVPAGVRSSTISPSCAFNSARAIGEIQLTDLIEIDLVDADDRDGLLRARTSA